MEQMGELMAGLAPGSKSQRASLEGLAEIMDALETDEMPAFCAALREQGSIAQLVALLESRAVEVYNPTILIIGNMMHHVCPRECCECALGHAHLFLKIIGNGNRVHFIPPGNVSAIRDIVPSLPG